ncbi:MAG: MBL fold metallo-hydrolase [Chloroflexota bacterium]
MTNNKGISRRTLLKGLGATALGAAFGGRAATAAAQIAGPSADSIAFYRFNVGDLAITTIKDGVSPLPAEILAANVDPSEVTSVLEAANLPTDQLLNTFNIMMIDNGEDIVLVDTGQGAAAAPNAGKLLPTMELLGMSPADVTAVVGTHWHPDHTNGLSADGSPVFANATYHFSQTEFDFVQANAEQFTGGAAGAIAPYADGDQLSLYNDGDEIVSGVSMMAAPGHTPGHHVVMLNSGGNSLMHLIDSAINAVVHVQNPTFAIQFDADPEMAAETRTSLLTMTANEQIPVMGYHFPFPGVGYIAPMGDTFRFVPYN